MSRGRRGRGDQQPDATGFDSRESRRSRRSGGPDEDWPPSSPAVVDGWPSGYGAGGSYADEAGYPGSGGYQGPDDGYSAPGSYQGQGGYPGTDGSSPDAGYGSYQDSPYQENGYGNGAYGGAGRPDDAYGGGGYGSYRSDDYSDPGYGRGRHSGSGYPGGHSDGFGQPDRYAAPDPYAGPDSGASGPYSRPDPRGATDPGGLTDPFGRTDPRGVTDPYGRADPGRHADPRGTAGSSSGALEPYRGGSGYDGAGYDGAGYDGAGYEGGSYNGAGYAGGSYNGAGYDRTGYDDGGHDQPGYGALEPYGGAGHSGAGYGDAGYGGAGHDSGGYDSAGHSGAGYGDAGYGGAGHDSAGYDGAGYAGAGYAGAGYAGAGYEGDSRAWAGQGERGYGGAETYEGAGGYGNRGSYSGQDQYGTGAYSPGDPYEGHDATEPGVGRAGHATGNAYGGGHDDRDYEPGWAAGQQDQYPAGEGGYGPGSYPSEQNYPGDPDQLADSGPSSAPGHGSRYDWQAPVDDTGMTRRRNRGGDEIDADDARHNNFFRGFGRGDDDYGHRPPKKRRRSRAGMVALTILIIFLAGIVAGGAYGYKWYEKRHANWSGSGHGSVLVQVKPGGVACGQTLENSLVNLGVVASATAFCDAAKAAGNSASLEPGYFRLHKHMSAAAAWALLMNPKSRVQTNVAIPDGLRATKIIALLAVKTGIPLSQFQSVLKNDVSQLGLPSWAKGSPEGFLYPATYPVQPGTSALEILKAMVAKFNSEVATLNLRAKAKAAHFSEYQLLIEASLLEGEVGPQYYNAVAQVIDNRLNDGWDLGLDSTVAYAVNKYIYNLSQSDLNVKSLYNTTKHKGLPPGPIDSPDVAAIDAVLHPNKAYTNDMYFVTVNKSGKTLFTDSAAQFNAWAHEAVRNGV